MMYVVCDCPVRYFIDVEEHFTGIFCWCAEYKLLYQSQKSIICKAKKKSVANENTIIVLCCVQG